MKIIASEARETKIASERYFTGRVLQTPIMAMGAPARMQAVSVSFEPGARTEWHTHPLGQTIYIRSGIARVQSAGGPVLEVRAGDVVSFAPNERHWHGAAPKSAMVHIAMHEEQDGRVVDWLEKVTDQEYGL